MDAKTINKQLKDLYDHWLNKDLANKYDIKEYTYPVLMKCNSKYCDSQTKILFIEQETKDWFTGNDGYKSTPKSKTTYPLRQRTMYNIDALMDWYDKSYEKLTNKVSSTDYFEKIMVKFAKITHVERLINQQIAGCYLDWVSRRYDLDKCDYCAKTFLSTGGQS